MSIFLILLIGILGVIVFLIGVTFCDELFLAAGAVVFLGSIAWPIWNMGGTIEDKQPFSEKTLPIITHTNNDGTIVQFVSGQVKTREVTTYFNMLFPEGCQLVISRWDDVKGSINYPDKVRWLVISPEGKILRQIDPSSYGHTAEDLPEHYLNKWSQK